MISLTYILHRQKPCCSLIRERGMSKPLCQFSANGLLCVLFVTLLCVASLSSSHVMAADKAVFMPLNHSSKSGMNPRAIKKTVASFSSQQTAKASFHNTNKSRFFKLDTSKQFVRKTPGGNLAVKASQSSNKGFVKVTRLKPNTHAPLPRKSSASRRIKVDTNNAPRTSRNRFGDVNHQWPVDTAATQRISSPFGMRKHPVTGKRSFHAGIDIATKRGTSVLASADGVVELTTRHRNLGNYVKIRHRDGSYSMYGHLTKWLVRKGEQVAAGETIGTVGSTGRSTGPHLDYSLRINDKPVNPMKFLTPPPRNQQHASLSR